MLVLTSQLLMVVFPPPTILTRGMLFHLHSTSKRIESGDDQQAELTIPRVQYHLMTRISRLRRRHNSLVPIRPPSRWLDCLLCVLGSASNRLRATAEGSSYQHRGDGLGGQVQSRPLL